MRLALTLLLIGSLAGCSVKYDLAGVAWTKAGTGINTVTQDEMECVRTAREAGRTPDLVVGGLVDVGRHFYGESQRGGAYNNCMTARGYQPS